MEEKTQTKVPRRGQALNLAVATLAALSLAFFIFAMPAEIFQALAGAVGIHSRGVAMAGAAALTFTLIFFILRALDQLPRKARPAPIELPAEPPRLRRADAHPDAPARVPVFARHELGDPLPIEQPEPEQLEPAGAEPVEALNDEAAEDVLELDQPLTGLLAGSIEVTEGEPVEREPAVEAPEQPLPSFIAQDPAEEPVEPAPVEEQPLPSFSALNEAEEPAVEPVTVEEQPLEAENRFAIDDQAAAVAEVIDDEVPAEAVSIEPAEIADEPATVAAAPEEATIHLEEQPAPIEQWAAPIVEMIEDEPPVNETPAIAAPRFVPEDQPTVASLDRAREAETAEPMPEIEPEPEALNDEPESVIEYNSAPAPAPAPIAEPIERLAARLPEVPQPRDETISDLMGRLETGLGRRDRALWLGQSEDEAPELPGDDRLKSAIGLLRRMAGRG
jgi:hypothetical protein